MKGLTKVSSDVVRIENNMISNRVYIGEYAGSCSVGQPQKRWIDNMKNYLKKRKFGCKASKENDVQKE